MSQVKDVLKILAFTCSFIVGGGLFGALIDHMGAWLYGWQPLGVCWWVGLVLGVIFGLAGLCAYTEDHWG